MMSTKRHGSGAHHRSRVRTPTVLQMEAVECGAASLGMVLGWFGRFVTLIELREACGVSRDGSKATNVASAAEHYGLQATGHRTEPDELVALGVPSILHWQFNHFVVFEGFDGDVAVINDPAMGRRRIDPDEFDHSFTGIAITFEPSEQFSPGGRPFSALGAVRSRLNGHSAGVGLAVIAGVLATIPSLVTPAISSVFVNDVLAMGARSFLIPLLIGVVLAGALRAGATYIQRYYLLRLQNALAAAGALEMLWRVLRLPMEFFSQRSIPDVATRIDTNTSLAQLLASQLASVLINALTALAFVIVMLIYSWQLTAIAVALTLVNLAALQLLLHRRANVDARLLRERTALSTTTMAGIQTIETLKATSRESTYFVKWSGDLARVLVQQNRATTSTIVLGAVPAVTSALSIAAIIIVGGIMVTNGQMSVGGLVAFQSLVISFNGPLQQIFSSAGLYRRGAAELARLDDVLAAPIAPMYSSSGNASTAERQSAAPLTGDVVIDNVTFGYSRRDAPLIDGLSLTISAGTRIAFVGASGAGKSTIVKLLTGLLTPWSGQVRFDGRTIDEISPEAWAHGVSVVDQDYFLLDGTVRDNLTLWDRTVPDRVIRQAAIDAAIDDDITARPGGYGAHVSEGGRNWSGGQAQRLELARALVREPAILVLDEATSALDPIVEQRIDTAIRRRGCTTLIVAHRLSTVRDADLIVVLDRGSVVEQGTHDELLAAGGRYAHLVDAGGSVGV